MNIKRISCIILILSLVFIGISGCTTQTQTPAETPVKKEVISGINGTIGTITYDNNNDLISFVIEGEKGNNPDINYFEKAIVTKTGVTKVYIGASEEDIPVNDLKEGMKAEVIFYGNLSNSHPIKATARTIRIAE